MDWFDYVLMVLLGLAIAVNVAWLAIILWMVAL